VVEEVIAEDEFEEMFLNNLKRMRKGARALW